MITISVAEMPIEVDVELLLELLEQDPRNSTTELANELSVDQFKVSRQLKVLGKQQKTDRQTEKGNVLCLVGRERCCLL